MTSEELQRLREIGKMLEHSDNCRYMQISSEYNKGRSAAPDDDDCDCNISLVSCLINEIEKLRNLIDDAFTDGFACAPESEYFVDVLKELETWKKEHNL